MSDADATPVRLAYRIHKDSRRRDVTYDRFSRAEAAARRLVEADPGETFVITQEVACVAPIPKKKGCTDGRG